jgi:hypothetical protein
MIRQQQWRSAPRLLPAGEAAHPVRVKQAHPPASLTDAIRRCHIGTGEVPLLENAEKKTVIETNAGDLGRGVRQRARERPGKQRRPADAHSRDARTAADNAGEVSATC